jgi:hypothetical protein
MQDPYRICAFLNFRHHEVVQKSSTTPFGKTVPNPRSPSLRLCVRTRNTSSAYVLHLHARHNSLRQCQGSCPSGLPKLGTARERTSTLQPLCWRPRQAPGLGLLTPKPDRPCLWGCNAAKTSYLRLDVKSCHGRWGSASVCGVMRNEGGRGDRFEGKKKKMSSNLWP